MGTLPLSEGQSSVEYHPASQNLPHFADVEYTVICIVLNVYRVDDGAYEFTGLSLLVDVAWARLPHSGGREVMINNSF